MHRLWAFSRASAPRRCVILRSAATWSGTITSTTSIGTTNSTRHVYYHQIQVAIAAVGVQWCDFVMWTPGRVKIERIFIDCGWSMRYFPRLENFSYPYLVRKEDTKSTGWDSHSTNASSDGDALERFEHPARYLTSILHPIGPAGQFLRHLLVQVLHVHLARWILLMQTNSCEGFKWPKAVDHFWNRALDNLYETCVRKLFKQRVATKVSSEYLLEVGDIIKNIEKEASLWSTLFFVPEFASMVKSRVHTWEATMEMQVAQCTCDPYRQTKSLRYGHPTPRESRFLMPPRLLTKLGPYPALQLDPTRNESSPQLKHSSPIDMYPCQY